MTEKTIKARIIEVLEQGAATPSAIAARLGLPTRNVSAYLCRMRGLGFVRVKEQLHSSGGGKYMNLWEAAV